ncbi:hypothetical protein R1sor_019352 [Riccia sorocarpa]|uniref:non-specific serine/threonine protein kinase n=1 Tax=Riccia sorocarpa TaxID=122646 RepID=A0ABD3IG29_9MARC
MKVETADGCRGRGRRNELSSIHSVSPSCFSRSGPERSPEGVKTDVSRHSGTSASATSTPPPSYRGRSLGSRMQIECNVYAAARRRIQLQYDQLAMNRKKTPYFNPFGDGKSGRPSWLRIILLLWAQLCFGLFLTVSAQSPPPACPYKFSVLDKFPYVAETLRKKQDHAFDCSTLTEGLEIVVSVYLRETGYFLPPVGTSGSCMEAYRSQLVKQGLKSSLNLTSYCRYESVAIDRSTDLCKGVQTASDFQQLVQDADRSLLSNLNKSCGGDLQSTTACGVCNQAQVQTAAVIQQVQRPSKVARACTNYTNVYIAGIVNNPGPLDPGTALCLFYVKTPNHRGGPKPAVFAAVGVIAVLALGGMVGFVFYRRNKKIKKVEEHQAHLRRTRDLLDSSRVPHSSVNWFTIDEIKKATGNFSRDNLLGSGGYGNVYKGTLQDGSIIAVKRFKNCSPAGDANFVHEVEMISSVRHKHLVAIRGCCVDNSGTLDGHQRIILYDYMPNGSLQDHLFPKKRGYVLDWPTRARIAIGMAKGLAYLHHDALPAIFHRDIKASNILLDDNFNARLADFGLAKFTPQGVSHVTTKVAGTFGYVAPEYALYGQLTEKSDVYSFGMVLLELVTGRKALSSSSDDPPQTLLSDWVWPLVKEGLWKAVVDPKMTYSSEEEVERFLLVALLCSHPVSHYRPTIGKGLKMLQGHLKVPELPDRPAPLTSSMLDIEAAGIDGNTHSSNQRTGFSSYTGSSSSRSTFSSRDPLNQSATYKPLVTSSSEL